MSPLMDQLRRNHDCHTEEEVPRRQTICSSRRTMVRPAAKPMQNASHQVQCESQSISESIVRRSVKLVKPTSLTVCAKILPLTISHTLHGTENSNVEAASVMNSFSFQSTHYVSLYQ